MVKTRIILAVVCIGLVILIFRLPKVVVDNDKEFASEDSTSSNPRAAMELHTETPLELQNAIAQIRSQYSSSGKEKSAIFADSLANLYSVAGKFDSAAWFAGEASMFFNTAESWEKAGNLYYQAYSFAVDLSKQNEMAEKARDFYAKLLERNPRNFGIKTKMAMTYLSSPSPMQGIMLLREVLAEDPQNEEALFNMGMLSIQSGQYERAAERMEELLKVNPNHVQGNLLLGIAFLNTGKRDEARKQFEKVKEMDKDPAVQATVDSYLRDLK